MRTRDSGKKTGRDNLVGAAWMIVLAACLAMPAVSARAVDLPIVLGEKDGKEAEFDAEDYANDFDADASKVKKFPKELNTTWWTWQDIHLTLDKEAVAKGITLDLIPTWTDGTGELEIEVMVYSMSHQDLVSVGKVTVRGNKEGVISIPSELLVVGRNAIRLCGVSGTDKTTVVVWDQIVVRETGTPRPESGDDRVRASAQERHRHSLTNSR